MSESGCFPKKLPTFHFSVKLQLWDTVSWLKSLPVLRWRSGASTTYHFDQPGTRQKKRKLVAEISFSLSCKQELVNNGKQWLEYLITQTLTGQWQNWMIECCNHCFIGNISPATFLRPEVFSRRQNEKKNACKLTESTLGSCTMR